MHSEPDLLPARVGRRQAAVGHPECLLGIKVCDHSGAGGGEPFHRMGQHIKPRIGDEPRGQLPQKEAVQNRQVRLQALIHQGILGIPMGQHREIRYFAAGPRGGGNGRQRERALAEIGHGFGAVHGAAAPQRHQQIRPKGL